jgi:murein DD-endopeptidase MepM/ murein hydrolase activator NlpD
VDLAEPTGAPVEAAAAGRVVWVGVRVGWGLVVTLAHTDGVRTMYAHLSGSSVRLGQRVAAGATIGLVGSTGDATGPHLHFEVRLRGAAVDPLSALEPKDSA